MLLNAYFKGFLALLSVVIRRRKAIKISKKAMKNMPKLVYFLTFIVKMHKNIDKILKNGLTMRFYCGIIVTVNTVIINFNNGGKSDG